MSDNKKITFNVNSLPVKISAVFLLMLILIFINGIASQKVTSDAMIKQSVQLTQNTIHQLTKSLEHIELSTLELHKQIIVDPRYQEYLATDMKAISNYERLQIYDGLESIMIDYAGTNAYISKIRVLNNELDFTNDSEMRIMNKINQATWYKDAIENNGRLIWTGWHDELDYILLKRTKEVSLYSMAAIGISQTYLSNKNEALLVFDINVESIRNLLEGINLGKGGEIHILSSDGRDIYSVDNQYYHLAQSVYNPDEKSEIINVLDSGAENGSFINYNGMEYLVIFEEILETKYKVIGLIPKKEIIKSTNKMKLLTYIVSAVFGSIIFVFGCIFIPARFSKNLNILLKKMRRIEKGDLSIKKRIQSKDEIGIIDDHFNKMVYKLEKQINENYVVKLEKSRAELEALQYQINPHFLYNTLEIINSIATVKNCYEISTITQKLGEMFRYNLNKDDEGNFVPLEKELLHIKNYIDIQKIRFEEQINVIFDIEENVKNYLVPKFILQPMLENAIKYGMAKKEEKGCIEVEAYTKNELLLIFIRDDGIGIEAKKLREILNDINNVGNIKNKSKSMGIKNVNQKIKLLCGKKYGLTIKSEYLCGVEIQYRLPTISM